MREEDSRKQMAVRLMRWRRPHILRFLGLVAVLGAVGTIGIIDAPSAQADVSPAFGIGATSLAKPATSSNRYIYVDVAKGVDFAYDPTGHTDAEPPWPRQNCLFGANKPYWASHNGRGQSENCPEPDTSHPMRSIKIAIFASRPGDVIVVRGGTYRESITTAGDGRIDHKGTSATKRLVLQNYPGESVRLNGWINFQDPDYWIITGIRFGYDSKITANRSYIVGMFGGTGWIFKRNEVSGAYGYSNMLVTFSGGTPAASTAPSSWRVTQNCIHDNNGSDPGNLDHNLYVKPSIYSRSGTIDRNLMWNAPNGVNIKLGGSQDPNESPVDLVVKNNTLLRSGSGIAVGLKAKDILITRNVIGRPISTDDADGGIKTYSMTYPSEVSVNDNYIGGWKNYIRETGTLPNGHIHRANNKVWNQQNAGTYAGCAIVAADAPIRNGWGHRAN